MIGSKTTPREIKLDSAKEAQCNQLYVNIQNKSMTIDDIVDIIVRDSNKLSRLSNDNSFRAIVSGASLTLVSFVRLLAVTGPKPKRLRKSQVSRALREARRILAGGQKIAEAARRMGNKTSEMEALARNIDFHEKQLVKERAKMIDYINQQKRFGCLD